MEGKEIQAIHRILDEIGLDNLVEKLEKIPLSDLNTLLLEVIRKRTNNISAGELIKKYSKNKFVHPSKIDSIWMKQLELDLLKMAQNSLYTPIQLSPVSPLGSCSVIATVNQNKVISAVRGTEVVSDATNLLALHICDLIKKGKLKNDSDLIRFSTTHRHIRVQKFKKPDLMPHFNIFCMITSGRDKGSYFFEKLALLEHIKIYQKIFKTVFNTNIIVKLNASIGYTDSEDLIHRLFEYINEKLPDVRLLKSTDVRKNPYYQGLQFTIAIKFKGDEIDIGDGGIVDWSQKLLSNRKERMLISGIGLEMIHNIFNIETY